MSKIGDDRVKEKVREYEGELEEKSLTTTDRAQIMRMAKLELAADDAIADLTSGAALTPTQRKALGDTAKSLSAEARQLADSLGMSRQKRLDSEEGDEERFIPKTAREAKEFLYRRAIAILCPHCREEKAHIEIVAGTIIYHFNFESEWSWTSKCPRCGKTFTINQDNYIEFLFSTINKFETEAERVNLEDLENDDQEEI